MSACPPLPPWHRVLAVVAHPDDESFGLGGVLSAFVSAGAEVSVLCLTHGEASTLHGGGGNLYDIRRHELEAAAAALGVTSTVLLAHPDGGLSTVCSTALAADVMEVVRRVEPHGLVVFDESGVTGHADHVAATAAALRAADLADLPVLGWALPVSVAESLNVESGTTFHGHPDDAIDCVVTVDRGRQRAAIGAHASQAVPTSVLWRRLELLGDEEHLRRLRPRDAGGGNAARDGRVRIPTRVSGG